MELSALLLLTAFRHRIEETDPDEGLSRVAAILGRDVDPNVFRDAVAELLAGGLISDPVQLRPGALQCRWHLQPTLRGVGYVLALLRERDATADELLARAGVSDHGQKEA